MKLLHLIRHAKSDWGQPNISDVERPLNERGEKACRSMALPISESGCSFANVFCSVANRAQSTIRGISEALPDQGIRWQVDEALYTFSGHSLLDYIHQLDDGLDDVVIVGHNPAMTELCNAMGDQSIGNVPTCGYAQLAFTENSWKDLGPGKGKMLTFLTPKMLK